MKNVLIIEDDRAIAMALAIRLKAAGYEACMAYDALAGLVMCKKVLPDLVLLDIGMPAGNGFLVAERIQRQVPRLTPIIFLTASKQRGFREKAEELGAVAYFEKPYKAQDLMHAVQGVLGE